MDRPNTAEHLAGGRLTIDLGAVADNWNTLNEMTPSAECGAVVKADAYGLGIKHVVPTLWEAGCRTFFVALPDEGIRVRKAAPNSIIYVLAGFFPEAANIFIQYDLRPVLNMEIEQWLEVGRPNKRPYAIQLETGMNRLGMRISDYLGLLASDDLPNDYPPTLLISHLACADAPGSALNALQRREFQRAIDASPGISTSFANSAGIFLGPEFHCDVARPGIALYGGACAASHLQSNPMKPTIKLEARILQVKAVPGGSTVGYGGAETALGDRVIATVSVGYADGFLRSAGSSDLQKGAVAAWRGRAVPIIGRVSMDLISIDLTDHPEMKSIADMNWYSEWIELIGPTIPLDQVATAAGTIGYELLTGLGNRYYRVYENNN